MKKVIAVMICVLQCTGCYASQRSSIDFSFQERTAELDRQCKNNMTDWCQIQYFDAMQRHQRELERDAEEVAQGNRRGWIAGVFVIGLAFIVSVVAWGSSANHP